MKILNNKKSLRDYIETIKKEGKTIGFAPTMGALHNGHLSLYQNAKRENDIVIGSIFVNPTQFNNAEDLEKYPRTIEKDLALLSETGNVDAIYLPEIEDIYPNGTKSKSYDFDGLENEMEGKFRAGHFDGVGTVVEELFLQVEPDTAYFGEKDFQQLAIIKKLVEKLHLPIIIKPVEIVREANGLAMSSRNQRLTEEGREKAKVIFEILNEANHDFKNNKSADEIRKIVKEKFEKIEGYDLEYVSIADEKTLKEVPHFEENGNYRIFIAVFTEGVRLIDNLHLG